MTTTHGKVTAAGLLGLAFGGASWAGGPPHPLLPADDAALYTQQSRAAVIAPLIAQARNGLVLDQTLWNYYFDLNRPERLHRSGAAVIDRVVRRHVEDGRPEVLHLFFSAPRTCRCRTTRRGPPWRGASSWTRSAPAPSPPTSPTPGRT